MPRSLPLACFALCVIGLLGRLMPKLYSQMPIFNRWSRRFAWLWKHVFPKVSVDHGCSSFRQNVKFFLTWMIWSRAKYLPSNYGNSMRRFHYVRIGSQKGAPCKLYMLWKVFLHLLQVLVKQTWLLHHPWFRHHHLLVLWLACLHVRQGSRFHLCPCCSPVLVWRRKVLCLKNRSKPCRRMAVTLRLKALFCNHCLWIWWMVRCLGFRHIPRRLRNLYLPFAILHVCHLTPLQEQKVWRDYLLVLSKFSKGLQPNLRPRSPPKRNLLPRSKVQRSVLLPKSQPLLTKSQQILIFQRERFRCISDVCWSQWAALAAGIPLDAVQAVGLTKVTKHWVIEAKPSVPHATKERKRKLLSSGRRGAPTPVYVTPDYPVILCFFHKRSMQTYVRCCNSLSFSRTCTHDSEYMLHFTVNVKCGFC